MHRDIKPDNIMISAKNQLEVVIAGKKYKNLNLTEKMEKFKFM